MYRLHRSRRILRNSYRRYRRRHERLPAELREALEEVMAQLDQALLEKDRKQAHRLARELEALSGRALRRSPVRWFWDTAVAIAIALAVAVVVRQMWFEPMEIPSGSMRPTYRELDRLLVTKTAYGLNIPMMPRQFLFFPKLLQLTSPFIFTSEAMDIADQDTSYLGIPMKRRLIKRCMGRPGDRVHFYGGQVYIGGKPLDREFYVPFISFEGKVMATPAPGKGLYSPVFLYQMNRLVARMTALPSGEIRGEVFDGKNWTTEISLGDLWGIKNYAMARLLTKRQLETLTDIKPVGEGELYLELSHTPSVKRARLGRDEKGRVRPMLGLSHSAIGLNRKHLDRLFSTLYTSRFYVKEGKAYPDRPENPDIRYSPYLPSFPDVPDGRYEFEDGVGYEVLLGGIRKRLPEDHPLMSRSPENLQRLFNLGIEMLTPFAPYAKDQPLQPSRYAWYRNGDLYCMNGVLFKRGELPDDISFIDHGPEPDIELELDGYLGLGDNYAASSDSRQFGPVPASNVRGTPSMLIWPPDGRWGFQNVPPRPLFTPPRLIVWGTAFVIYAIYRLLRHNRANRPIFKKINRKF